MCRRAAAHGDVTRDLRFQLCADVFAAARPTLLGAAVRFAPEAWAAEGAASSSSAKSVAPVDLAAAAAAAASIERRRIIAPVYKMKKDADLRKDLGAWGLHTTGTRDEIEFRHRQYIHAFNAEQDAPNPRPATAIVAQVRRLCTRDMPLREAGDAQAYRRFQTTPFILQVRATEREHAADRASSRAIARSKIDPLGALFTGATGGGSSGGGAHRAAAVIEIDDDGDEDAGGPPVASAAAAAPPAAASPAAAAVQASPASAPPPLAAPDQRPFVTVTSAMRDGFRRLREELSAREAARKAQRARSAQTEAAAAMPPGGSAAALTSPAGSALRSHAAAAAGPPTSTSMRAGSQSLCGAPLCAPAPGVDLAAVAAAAARLPARFRVLYSEVAGRPFYFDEEAGVGSFEPPVAEDGAGADTGEGSGALASAMAAQTAAMSERAGASAATSLAAGHAQEAAASAPDSSQGGRRTPRAPKGRSPAKAADTAVTVPEGSPPAPEMAAGARPPGSGDGAAAPTPLAARPRGSTAAAAARSGGASQVHSQQAAAVAAERPEARGDHEAAIPGLSAPPKSGAATGVPSAASSGGKRRRASSAAAPAASALADGAAPEGAALDTGISTRRGPVAAPAAADATASVGAWQCDRCTFSNKRASRKCQMCNQPRAASAPGMPAPPTSAAAAGTTAS